MRSWTDEQMQTVANYRAGLLTLAEAAHLTGRSKSAVRRKMQESGLPRPYVPTDAQIGTCGYLTPGTSYRCGLPKGHGKHNGVLYQDGIDIDELIEAANVSSMD